MSARSGLLSSAGEVGHRLVRCAELLLRLSAGVIGFGELAVQPQPRVTIFHGLVEFAQAKVGQRPPLPRLRRSRIGLHGTVKRGQGVVHVGVGQQFVAVGDPLGSCFGGRPGRGVAPAAAA